MPRKGTKRGLTSQVYNTNVAPSEFVNRPAVAAGDAEMAVMNPMSAPLDVVFGDEWGKVNALPARPHAEFGGTWTPGVVGTNGTATAVQQPGVPTTDRPFVMLRHPLRQWMIYMQNSPANSGVTAMNTLGQVAYTAINETAGGVDNPLFPIAPGAAQFLQPCYAVPSSATNSGTGITGLVIDTWPVHGNYLYPGHDNGATNINQNTYGLWLDASGSAGASAGTAGQVRISVSVVPTAGAVETFILYAWDGVKFSPYINSTGSPVEFRAISTDVANQWYAMIDGTGNQFAITNSNYYAVQYAGNVGTADGAWSGAFTVNVRMQVVNGLTSDAIAHICPPNMSLVRNTMRRMKNIGVSILWHNSTQVSNLAGLGTCVACDGGDWDPITDFLQATGTTTSQSNVSGLPAIAGNLYNLIAATDDARDFDPKVGLYTFAPAGDEDTFKWMDIWKWGNVGITGTYGFPIIPQDPFVIGAFSIPQIVVGGVTSSVQFTVTIAAYYNYEMHSTNDWIPRFRSNVNWNTVRGISKLLAITSADGGELFYVMPNAMHWNDIKQFIRRHGGKVLKYNETLAINPVLTWKNPDWM